MKIEKNILIRPRSGQIIATATCPTCHERVTGKLVTIELRTGGAHVSESGNGLIELRFILSLDIEQVISETLFPANLLASTEKIKIRAGTKKHKQSINL